MIKITRVRECFTDAKPFLLAGLEYNPFLTWEELERSAQQLQEPSHIFTIERDGVLVGAIACECLYNDGDRFYNVISIGTTQGTYEVRGEILAELEKVAQFYGCIRMILCGRNGWKQLGQEAGYNERTFTVLWKDLT